MVDEQSKYPALQIHGGELRGKTYALIGLVQKIIKSGPQIIFQLQFNKSTSLDLEVKSLIQSLQNKRIIMEQEFLNFDAENPLVQLVEHLIENRISSIFIFDNPPDKDKSVLREVATRVIHQDSSSKPVVQMLVAKNNSDFIFSEQEAGSNLNFYHFEITGFTDQESLDYLTSDRPDEIVFYRYVVDDNHLESDSLYNKEEAKMVALFYNNNPGCLRIAKRYCLTRKLSYKQYFDALEEESAFNVIAHGENIIAENQSFDLAKSLQATRLLFKVDKNHSDKQFSKMQQILKILSFLNPIDIPVHLIGKICQDLRKDQLSAEESFEMNKIEVSEMVYRMEELHLLNAGAAINYPNGLISIENNCFRSIVLTEGEKIAYLQMALESLAKMISKDNKERKADVSLCYLMPHIESIRKHIEKYLVEHLDVSDKKEENFILAMRVSRLYELLGQGIVQERRTDLTVNAGEKSAEVLMEAVKLVYRVMQAFNRSMSLFSCFSRPENDELLMYDGTKDPAVIGNEIAKKCVEAGRKVGGAFIEKYLKSSLVLNKDNYKQFMAHTIQMQGLSEKEATEKLKPIKTLVEKSLNFETSHMNVLRETGNFLSTEQLSLSFFGDRLTSIFHTRGRQVLYLQSKMSESKQKECEYYTLLSHNVAKAIREETGVCLLFEYISMANARLHRLLQNTNEDRDEKLNRINEARLLCHKLLNTSRDHYESGCFQRVQGYAYAKLNISRNLVKANTKALKYIRKEDLPTDATARCEEILKLARENYTLDMASHVFIQGAKFYAAIDCFDKAFSTFSEGFVFKKEDGSDTGFGIMRLTQQRPRTVAWAVDNFCRAVEAYSKHEKDETKIQQIKSEALKRCQQVIDLDEPEWNEKMKSWKKLFSLGY